MKTVSIGIVGLLMLAGGLSAQKAPSFSVRNSEIFIGQIADSLCADNGHHSGVINQKKNCTLACVKFGGAQFVLYNSETKRMYKLDDQQKPEAFAGQDVTVTGRYDEEAKEIHVINIRPKITYASLY
jgi:hypothetical protein